MSMKDGGPAFPSRGGMMFYVPKEAEDGIKKAIEGLDRQYAGLSLRDYFAGQALLGLLMRDNAIELKTAAGKAYTTADFMLKVREVDK